MAELDLFSTSDLQPLLTDLERTLRIVRETIEGLPPHEIPAARLIHIAELEEKRSAYRREIAAREGHSASSAAQKKGASTAARRKEGAVVLYLAANPMNTARLQLDEEVREIEQKIRASDARDLLTFKTRWAVRPDDLLQALNENRPRIVHFSGHGTHRAILLEGEGGQTWPVSNQALTRLFRALGDGIRLVVLNACFSRAQAEVIAGVVPCAIGMNFEIEDQAARVFAASFYRAIGFGHSVQNAFDQGVAAVSLAGFFMDGEPALLARADVNPDQLFVLDDHSSD